MALARKGKKASVDTGEAESPAQLPMAPDASLPAHDTEVEPTVFVDLDGTLVDFEGAVKALGACPTNVNAMWDKISKTSTFWCGLPWLDDGQALWQALVRFKPTVLTGLPAGKLKRRAEEEKRQWCREHLGADVVVLCVSSHEKQRYAAAGHILVDDSAKLREPWEERGGCFVLRGSLQATLQRFHQAVSQVQTSSLHRPKTKWEALYSAVLLSDASRRELLRCCPVQHERVHAEHVTLQVLPDAKHLQALPLGQAVQLQVNGLAADARGQVASVRFLDHGLAALCGSGRPHVTISTAVAVSPGYSLELLARKGLEPLEAGAILEGTIGVVAAPTAVSGASVEEVAARKLPTKLCADIKAFVAAAEVGEELAVEATGTDRKPLQDYAAVWRLGCTSGKRRNGKCQLHLLCTESAKAVRRAEPEKRRVVSKSELSELGLLSPTARPSSAGAAAARGEARLAPAAVVAEAAPRAAEPACGFVEGLSGELSEELASSVRCLLSTAEQLEERRRLARSISQAVEKACGAKFQLSLVGSAGADLMAASSDLDFALVPADLTAAEQPAGLRGCSFDSSAEQHLLQSIAGALNRLGTLKAVEVVKTRSKAPSLVKCTEASSGRQCDIVVRHGTGGAVASVDKAALLRAYVKSSPLLQPLALLIKHWAKHRQLIAPTLGKLNSFTWTLMAVQYLQGCGYLPVLECSLEGLRKRRTTFDSRVPDVCVGDGEIKVSYKGLAPLLLGFFTFWRQFDFHEQSVSVRLGRCYPASAARVPHPAGGLQAFLCEDPVEPDENTARTLSDRHLEELRAELNRACLLLSQGRAWSEVSCAPAAKKAKELKMFYLPERALLSGATADGRSLAELISSAGLPSEAARAMQEFVLAGACATWCSLPVHLDGAQRRSLHHLANLCGVESRRVGAAVDGKHMLQVKKPQNWESQQAASVCQPVKWSPSIVTAILRAVGKPPHPAQLEQPESVATPPPAQSKTGGGPCEAHASLKTVALLRQGMLLEQLRQKYKLIAKFHDRLPLVQLSYSLTESQMASPIVQECRGLILDTRTWNIVALPFHKFFNYGEKYAASLDWDSGIKVYEKVDGSLITLYWSHGEWHVATSKLPAADGLCPCTDGSKVKFADMFWQIWKSKGYTLPHDHSRCFIFELCSPVHTIIVRHEDVNLVCIGARDLMTLAELSCEQVAAQHGWEIPRRFDHLSCLHAVVSSARSLNPVVQEGYVIVDRNWNRLKVKSAGYVALHHMGGNMDRGGISGVDARGRRRSLLQIARSHEGDEFLAYYPDLEEEFRQVQLDMDHLAALLEAGLEHRLGPSSSPAPLLSRCLRRIQHQGGARSSVAEVLRDAKIQELEQLLEESRLFEDGFGPHQTQARSRSAAGRALVRAVDGQTEPDDEGRKEDGKTRSGEESMPSSSGKRRIGNAFQGLMSESSSESESEDDDEGRKEQWTPECEDEKEKARSGEESMPRSSGKRRIGNAFQGLMSESSSESESEDSA